MVKFEDVYHLAQETGERIYIWKEDKRDLPVPVPTIGELLFVDGEHSWICDNVTKIQIRGEGMTIMVVAKLVQTKFVGGKKLPQV
jgi:hypothetical protein